MFSTRMQSATLYVPQQLLGLSSTRLHDLHKSSPNVVSDFVRAGGELGTNAGDLGVSEGDLGLGGGESANRLLAGDMGGSVEEQGLAGENSGGVVVRLLNSGGGVMTLPFC